MTRHRTRKPTRSARLQAPESDDASPLQQLLRQAPVTDTGNPCDVAHNGPRDEDERTIRSERLVFEATTEIVIRCGAASITLTEGGKVLIKGEYVLSRSTGTNRIRGGSVQIN